MTLVLGHDTDELRLHLVEGSAMPATTVYDLDGNDWPSGMVAQLVFANGATWTATVSGDEFTFTATQAQVAAQSQGSGVRLVLDGTTYWIGVVVKPRG